MLNHITTNQCRMLLQEANFIKKQYPKRIKEFHERIKNQILIRNLKTEILYMDNRLLQIKILENMMIRLKSMQVQCIEQTYFERKKPLQICQKLYISRSAYYRYLNKGIEELTKLYNQNIVSDAENEEK